MLAIVVAAAFEHVDEALDIRIDIGVGMLERIANAGLCREMDDHGKAVLREKRLCCRAVREIELHKGEIGYGASGYRDALPSASDRNSR